MKFLRTFGSLAFVIGLFTAIFVGGIWEVHTSPDLPLWLKIAIYFLLGGILVVLATVAFEQKKGKSAEKIISSPDDYSGILIQNSEKVPGYEIDKNLGLVQGHTIYAIWIGKDLSAIIRLVLGGELIEYTEMMGGARKVATSRMLAQAEEMGADAVINVRFMTTSVIGSAAELLAYGTAVKLSKSKARL